MCNHECVYGSKAAGERGHADALCCLGSIYFNGWGDGEVEQNYSAAFRCYLAASKMGHVEALSNLGSMYWHGQGCSANRELAMECLEAVEKHRGAAPGDVRA